MVVLHTFNLPIQCIEQAAIQYHIPAKLILSVLNVEGGKVGKVTKNKNGSYDIGLMQINSNWLKTLTRYGITSEKLKNDACLNVKVGTWILGKKIAHGASLAAGIGDYNSHNYQFNQIYYRHVKQSIAEINAIVI